MIVDKEECKRYLQITNVDSDALIEAYIPIVQEDLVEYCNNFFPDEYVTYLLGECSFVRGTSDTITDNQSEFVKKRFAAGMDIYVESGTPNDGIHEISTVAAGTLTLTSSNELVSIAYNDSTYNLGAVRITKINWPKALKIVAARMVGHLVRRELPGGEMSESIDGTVVAYDRARSYPREIMEMANKYRRPDFV